ncbi:MAG: hypothetical protein WCJ81_06880 [bacterium]
MFSNDPEKKLGAGEVCAQLTSSRVAPHHAYSIYSVPLIAQLSLISRDERLVNKSNVPVAIYDI